jgi:hypothetical protein
MYKNDSPYCSGGIIQFARQYATDYATDVLPTIRDKSNFYADPPSLRSGLCGKAIAATSAAAVEKPTRHYANLCHFPLTTNCAGWVVALTFGS